MGVTDSLTELYSAIRTRLLTYNDGGAEPNTITEAVGTRVYNEAPPDPAVGTTLTVPYLVLTIDGNPAMPDTDRVRMEFQVEVQVVNRDRTTIAATRRIADLVFKALANYQVATAGDGFVKLRVPMLPETLPPGGGDADRQVVQIRIVSEGFAYWRALALAP